MRGRAKIIAVKQNIDICPWADVVYGCDAAWWQHRQGLPKFGGLKICWSGNGLVGHPDIRRIDLREAPESTAREKKYLHQIIVDTPGVIGSGWNSGFQALNLAVQFGARRILLIGFDMQERSGVHWYGRNTWPMANNPDYLAFGRWLVAFDAAALVLADMGVEVINTSPITAMKSFPRRSIDDTLRDWA